MRYHFKIHKDKTGCWAECLELEGCVTQAENAEVLGRNMEEALNLFLDEPADSKAVFPFPGEGLHGRNIKEVQVDPAVALAFQIRMLRLMHNMTQKEAAGKMGLKNLFSYQRLESSRTANPALKTLCMIKKVFPELSIDAVI